MKYLCLYLHFQTIILKIKIMEQLTEKQKKALSEYQKHIQTIHQNEQNERLKDVLRGKETIKVLFQTDEGVLFLERLKLDEIPVKGELLIWMRICFEIELVIRDYDNK